MTEYCGIFKKLVIYVTSVLLLLFAGYITFHAAGTIPQAKNIFSGRSMYGLIILAAMLLLLLFLAIGIKSAEWRPQSLKLGTALLFFLIVLVQLLYLYFVRFIVNYDNLLVLHEAREMQVTGQIDPELYNQYFARYPHNYPVTILLYMLLAAAEKLNMTDLHWIPCLFGMACMDAALLFSAGIVRRVRGLRQCFLYMIFCACNPVVYLWITWHYTSVCSLPFLMGSAYFAVLLWQAKGIRKQIAAGAAAGFLMAAGGLVRVTTLILLIALIIFGIAVKCWKRLRLRYVLPAALLCAALVFGSASLLEKKYVHFDSTDTAFGLPHYLMMGLGGNGLHNPADVAYTLSFEGAQAKREADLAEAARRLEELGPKGLFDHLKKKLLITWQDGSAGLQVQWLQMLRPSRAFLYICGQKNDPFLYYCQSYYVMILLLLMAGTLYGLVRKIGGIGLIFRLTLLGNMLFFLIWEAQDHYSIQMVFILLFLAQDGLWTLCAPLEGQIREGRVSRRRWQTFSAGSCLLLFLLLAVLLYQPLVKEEFTIHEYLVHNFYDIGQKTDGLTEGNVVTQTFTADRPFNALYLRGGFEKSGPLEGSLELELLDQNGEVAAGKLLTADEISGGILRMYFAPVSPQGTETYTIRAVPRQITEKNPLMLKKMSLMVDIYPGGSLTRDGVQESGDLLFSVYLEEKVHSIDFLDKQQEE